VDQHTAQLVCDTVCPVREGLRDRMSDFIDCAIMGFEGKIDALANAMRQTTCAKVKHTLSAYTGT